MSKKLVIIGASGHGKVVADIAKKTGYEEIVFLDDDLNVKSCGKYPVVGSTKDILDFLDCEFIVAIGNGVIRETIQKKLMDYNCKIVSLIHPTATVADDVQIKPGTVVMAGSVINPGSIIGEGCIINTCSSVDHDCYIKDFVHVSVGAHVAGNCHIGERTWIGAGSTVNNNVNICSDCMIGSGAVVIKDIKEIGTYIGVPATLKS